MAKGKYEQWLKPEGLAQLEMWARQGLTSADIAKNIGIARQTFEKWKSEHSDIGDSIKKGNVCADQVVENALYRRAQGYDAIEQEKRLLPDPVTGDLVLMVVKERVRHIPPDTTAQIFWLKNRCPEVWREKQREEASGDNEVIVTFDVDEEDDQ